MRQIEGTLRGELHPALRLSLEAAVGEKALEGRGGQPTKVAEEGFESRQATREDLTVDQSDPL